MRNIITVTRKGQTTLPAELRRKLNINHTGGVLAIDFDEEKNIATISQPMTIEELSARASSYIRPSTKPLRDVRAFVNRRKVDHQGYADAE